MKNPNITDRPEQEHHISVPFDNNLIESKSSSNKEVNINIEENEKQDNLNKNKDQGIKSNKSNEEKEEK